MHVRKYEFGLPAWYELMIKDSDETECDNWCRENIGKYTIFEYRSLHSVCFLIENKQDHILAALKWA